jgi:uncharacterized protein (DUF433 family)
MKKLGLNDRRRTPAYPFSEAAHYLGLPKSTLRAWCLGQHYRLKGKTRWFEPVIALDGEPSEGLSFLNLIEAHVLAAIRRIHGIPLPKVRRALEFVSRKLGVERPLAHADFQTNGIDLFVDELGRLVNVSADGQLEMTSMLKAHLRRIERDAKGVPIKLFPFIGSSKGFNAPAPVEVDPWIAFGRPVLKGRAVPTAVLADRFKAGDRLAELAADYGVPPDLIEEAIRCEFDRHKAA